MAHDRSHLSERGMLRDHVRPDVRMPTHDLPLFFAERSGLIENIVAHTYLPEVMKSAGSADELAFRIAELKMFAESTRHF
jgi:hypothetical protein